jgi:hypothetical protein
MAMPTEGVEAHFLDTPSDETADEFLKRNLAFVEEEFAYEELSGLPMEELDRQIQACNAFFRVIRGNFVHENFIFADDPEGYEIFFGEPLDMYGPLTDEQENQIYITEKRVQRNFARAYSEARERKYERLTKLIEAFPIQLPPW